MGIRTGKTKRVTNANEQSTTVAGSLLSIPGKFGVGGSTRMGLEEMNRMSRRRN